MKLRAWLAVLAIPLSTVPAACANTHGEPLRIGYAAWLTGDGGQYDAAAINGARVQVARLNALGGANGRPLELLVEDIGPDPRNSATAAQALIDAGADVLLVPSLPIWSDGATATAAQAGIPVLSTVGTIPRLLEGGDDLAFLNGFGDNVQAAAAAQHLRSSGTKTALVVVSPVLASYSDIVPDYFAQAFEDQGGTVIDRVDMGANPDGSVAVVRALEQLDDPPDAIYAALGPPQLTGLLAALDSAGYDGTVIASDAAESAELFEAGEPVDGTLITAHAYASTDRLAQGGVLFAPRTPAERLARFAAGYERYFGTPPTSLSFAALGADVIDVIHAAAERAADPTPGALRDAIDGLRDVEVTTGRVTYLGQDGVPRKVVYLLRAERGEFELEAVLEPDEVPAPRR
jgi:branched-chain amino acid transport system substrate-binding protein